VIEHPHVHQRQSRLQRLRQELIGPTGLDGTGGMVVGKTTAAACAARAFLTTSRGYTEVCVTVPGNICFNAMMRCCAS
jgi:hypothetical protein